MLGKVSDIALGTPMAGGVTNRRQLISITTGVVIANNSTLLKDFSGDLVLTEEWAATVLENLSGTSGKVGLEKLILHFSF